MITKIKKKSHISKVSDHIHRLDVKIRKETKGLYRLSGIELYTKAEELKEISSRMNELMKYYRLIRL